MCDDVTNAGITADGWTSFSQDHYLTVTLHYVREGQSKEKVLKTKAVYQAQTGIAVAEEIEVILEEFGVKEKVVAATVDNAANMDVAVKKLNIIKFHVLRTHSSEAVQLQYSFQLGSKDSFCDCMDEEIPHG